MNAIGIAKLLIGTSITTAIGLGSSSALAQSGTIGYIENNVTSGTAGVQITSDPVITAILSQPGTVDGKTYSNWSFLANDGTGSMDIFASAASLTALGFTPAVGNTISVTGTYSPYNAIPELGTLTAISSVSTASVPAVGTTTVGQLKTTLPGYGLLGYELTVDNATLGGFNSFGTANQTGTITDSTGSMTMYYWESSYSAALQNLYGITPQAGTEYDVTGFVDVLGGTTPEFVPISITTVPEPATCSMIGLGSLMLFQLLRRRTA